MPVEALLAAQRGGKTTLWVFQEFIDKQSTSAVVPTAVSIAIYGLYTFFQVKDTIGYDTLGHCFFLEDGTEQRNTFYHNLGLLTRSGTILPSDRNEAMCLAIRSHVYGNYVPVPSTDCM